MTQTERARARERMRISDNGRRRCEASEGKDAENVSMEFLSHTPFCVLNLDGTRWADLEDSRSHGVDQDIYTTPLLSQSASKFRSVCLGGINNSSTDGVERVLGGDLNAPISIIASKIDLESISKRHRLHLSCMLQGAFPYFSTLAAVNCALSAASGKGTGYPCTTL